MGCLNDYCYKCWARLPPLRGWICENCEFWERMERVVKALAEGNELEGLFVLRLMSPGEQIFAWKLLEAIEAGC
jgi:predicted amidophosphoribosyltransferase